MMPVQLSAPRLSILLTIVIIALAVWIYLSGKNQDRLEIDHQKQSERVESLNNQLERSRYQIDSLQTVLDSTIIKRLKDEKTFDSLRNNPSVVIKQLRTANPNEIESYFLNRYR